MRIEIYKEDWKEYIALDDLKQWHLTFHSNLDYLLIYSCWYNEDKRIKITDNDRLIVFGRNMKTRHQEYYQKHKEARQITNKLYSAKKRQEAIEEKLRCMRNDELIKTLKNSCN